MKYVISVSKTYTHRGNHRHKSKTKKYWHVYYFDEEGHLRTEKVNLLQALYYKSRLYKRRRFYCLECEGKFVGLVKKETDSPSCPDCSSSITICHNALVETILNELEQSLDEA